VISAFHTKKGAVVYSAGGDLNWSESVRKSGTLTSLVIFFLQEFRVSRQTINMKIKK
jgi:hypothetical protein